MTAAAPGIGVEAPAKINLFLHVTGRRPDGYHLLESLVAFAGVHDRIEVRAGKGLSLEIEGPFAAALDAGGENLAVKAARALAGEAGIPPDARIRLHKALPVAAGIGGGSADAAAALRALSALWRVSVPAERLGALALALGADVPVCLSGRPGIVRGIGERIAPAPVLPEAPMVLVNPAVPLPTAGVFAAREGPFSAPASFGTAPPTRPRSRRRSRRRATISPRQRGASVRKSTPSSTRSGRRRPASWPASPAAGRPVSACSRRRRRRARRPGGSRPTAPDGGYAPRVSLRLPGRALLRVKTIEPILPVTGRWGVAKR